MVDSRLSRIDTQWSLVRQAHQENSGLHGAQAELFEQYGQAVRRYLLASLRDEDAAAEVFQEFALRLIRGDFREADSHRGKFRSYLKTVVHHLMMDYYRRNKRDRELQSQLPYIQSSSAGAQQIDEFAIAWRQALLDEAWNRLEQLQQQTSKPYFTVLRARVEQPQWTTRQLFLHLAENCPELPSESGLRVFIHRARKRFAVLVRDQVVASLNSPTPAEVEAELIELGLHHFTKPLTG